MLQARKAHPVFGVGGFEPLEVANEAVFAFLRTRDVDSADDVVLCVNSLSRWTQPVRLDFRHLAGKRPIELFGQDPFPAIGELPYFVTLPPYGFYWFSLVDELGDDLT